MDDNMSALQAYKSSDRLDLASRFRRAEPNPNPAARIIIQEVDPGLFEGCLDPHQGRDVAHSSRRGRLFGLFWPLMFAQSHTGAADVLVDELDACQLQGAPDRGRS